ncbi:unnamed protein product [Staurois parvus]|uniref:Uncharacterized protein n=1 Tax=Staurois parvus TaxID=386267 RepID=A0ABN9FBN4_9NEOB|nr:unnamed protein product [Staurois parvus]
MGPLCPCPNSKKPMKKYDIFLSVSKMATSPYAPTDDEALSAQWEKTAIAVSGAD